jgi:hypothetical protein
MTTQVVTTWKKEWFEIEDATYLNTAAHTVMPRVPIRAVEHALEAKKFPHRVDARIVHRVLREPPKTLSCLRPRIANRFLSHLDCSGEKASLTRKLSFQFR